MQMILKLFHSKASVKSVCPCLCQVVLKFPALSAGKSLLETRTKLSLHLTTVVMIHHRTGAAATVPIHATEQHRETLFLRVSAKKAPVKAVKDDDIPDRSSST